MRWLTDTETARFESTPQTVHDGIPSWTSENRPLAGVSTESIRAVVDALENRPLREALKVLPKSSRASVRNSLFVSSADAWRIPVYEHIGGRCLDVNAGAGTRSLLLAELADTVDAAGRCREALRFLDLRDDYDCDDCVYPLHAQPTTVPAPTTPYDTIVADFTGLNQPSSLSAAVEHLSERLSEDGSVILQLEGWPRAVGLTDALDFGSKTAGPSLASAIRTASIGYEQRLSGFGFDSVELYALLPDSEDPSFVLPLDDAAATRQLLVDDPAETTATTSERVLRGGAAFADSVGILDRCWPSYLAVCHNGHDGLDGRTDDHDGDVSIPDGLLRRGGGRSSVFGYQDGRLDRVVKIPHRRAHAEFILDEHRVTSHLRTDGNGSRTVQDTDHDGRPFVETIPSGSIQTTRFGPTYIETPMEGTPLSKFVTTDPEQFRRVLELGFEWLTRLHRGYGERPISRSKAEVRKELSFSEFGLEPPTVDGPTRLFRAPCHGDFHPKNVFVDVTDESSFGPITAVIDWELAGLDGNPIADTGFFVLQTVRLAFDGLREGIKQVFESPGVHADIIRSVVSEYCSAVDITPEAFLTYLPVVWIRRLKRCRGRGATASYSARALRRAADVEYLWSHRDDIASAIGVET